MVRFAAGLCVALVSCSGSVFAQTFEVASVKTGGPPAQTLNRIRGGPGTNDPTRFTCERVPLVQLVMRAYGVLSDQISGPDWINDYSDPQTLYTLNAVVPAGTSSEQFNRMLQNLLAERFDLRIHREAKEFPGYDLVVADGGPKIRACVAEADSANVGQAVCTKLPMGSTMTTSLSRGIGTWGMIHQRFIMPMADFAEKLGAAINEANGLEANTAMPRVADKSGLKGTYEFSLEFAGVVVLAGMQSPSTGDVGVGPSLFSVLEKQLGLKLVKTKNVPVDFLIIDHANRLPTEN